MTDSPREQSDVPPEFLETVVNWLSIDDKIHDLTGTIKELKDQKKIHEENILAYLNITQQDFVQTLGGNLRKSTSVTKGALKTEYIQEAVKEITQNEEQATKLVHTIMQKRPVTERVYLKKCNKRKPRKKEVG